MKTKETEMFELQPQEILVPVVFREGGRKYRVEHYFRAPRLENWIDYEAALNTRVEESGTEARMDSRTLEAADLLWSTLALRVSGYGEPTDSWRTLLGEEKVPLMHKAAAIRGLGQVSVAEPEIIDLIEPYDFDPDFVTIEIQAARDGVIHTRLLHRLRRPSPQQLKDFSRISSSAIWLRGSRTPTTLLPSRLKALVGLYDALIESVEGYSGNQPWSTCMDAMHKKVVIQALFAPEEETPCSEPSAPSA